ncbi:MAG: SRPBCC domain-containing protein [Haloarculaceae archaeon]
MKEIFTTVDIEAPAEVVWDVLVDFERYPVWNPRTRITGTAAAGERLVVAPGPEADGMPTFRPRVLRADGTELRWLGHLYVRGLFDGEHVFTVEDLGNGRSRLVQTESFGGILARPLLWLYGDDTRAGFEAVNEALKDRAEALVESGSESESGSADPAGGDSPGGAVEGGRRRAEATVDTTT